MPKKKNISVSDDGNRVTCLECGAVWSPNILPGGRRNRGWWRCHNGCSDRVAPVEGDLLTHAEFVQGLEEFVNCKEDDQ